MVADAQDDAMAQIVNLRRVKKRREQAAASIEAKENRIRHGRTKAQKANDERLEARRRQLLDASRRGEAGE